MRLEQSINPLTFVDLIRFDALGAINQSTHLYRSDPF
jgi:hypothetical protein